MAKARSRRTAKTDVQLYFEKQMKNADFARAYEDGLADLQIAVRIVELRQRRGLSQTQLAVLAKTSQAVISRIENQNVLPELSTLVRIAKALDAKLSVALTPDEEAVRRRVA